MKKLIILFIYLLCITSISLCENYYKISIEFLGPIPKNNDKPGYTISALDNAIVISSLATGSQIWVFDASGRNIYNKTAKNSSITVPIRSNGIFIIRIKSDKEIFTSKILVR